MTYVAYAEHKTDAQQAADRKADEEWMRDHRPVPATTEPLAWGADSLVGCPAPSAH